MSFLTEQFLENDVWRWFLSLGIILFVWIMLRVVLRLIMGRMKAYAARTAGQFDDLVVELLDKTKLLFVLIVSVFFGSLALDLSVDVDLWLRRILVLALLVQAGYWANAFITFWINRSVRRRLSKDAAAATSLAAMGFIAKLAVWTLVLLVALDNLGFSVTGLITGLGIGGIAIALAVQNILGDLFASLSIIIDKPFVIGDFIIVGDLMGTVERIGLKTTRVRSLSGEQIIFSNGDLLGSRVRNYKRMHERRIVFTVGVTYDTPADAVERIPSIIQEVIESQPDVRFDRSHFKSFGSYSLDIETVYIMQVADYAKYMDTQQAINLALLRRFADEGIDFAFPTQTLLMEGTSERK